MNPFASKNLFKLKELNTWPSNVWHGFHLDADLQSESLHLAEGAEVGLSDLEPTVLRLSLEDVLLDDFDAGNASTASRPRESNSDQETSHHSEIDLWDVASLSCKEIKHGLLSWDNFNNRHFEAQPLYLSEAGEGAFDAIKSHAWQEKHRESLRYANIEAFMQGALNVLVGRSSEVFSWAVDTRSFVCQLDQVAISGHSTELTATLCKTFCKCGTMFKIIQAYCKTTEPKCATSFALQSSMSQILGAVEADLQRKMTGSLTLVKMADTAHKYLEIYDVLQTIVLMVQNPGEEAAILVMVIEFITKIWTSNFQLRPILTDLADKMLQPSIRQTQQQIGLSTEPGVANTDTWVLAELLPENVFTFQETLKCLHVGGENSVQIRQPSSSVVPIQIAHEWSDIVKIQDTANSLEIEFCKSFTQLEPLQDDRAEKSASSTKMNRPSHDPFEINFDMALSEFLDSSRANARDIRLSDLVLAVLGDEGVETEIDLSPMEMLSVSLTPILNAQHRICSYALLRSLFLQQDLVAHLDLLHSYHLLGTGSFAARLSKALFDADQYSAQGRRKTGLTAGLRLENRDVWPPASSELRLVLMGLLSESTTNKTLPDLTENISFAIRDLSEEEMELCRDVHSVHALDFLRLTYAPPNHILELIITPTVLDKYDQIFKFLLVLLRIHALSQSLLTGVVNRNANHQPDNHHHRFCLELHHFVTSFLDYALNVASSMTWSKMIRFFQEVHNVLLKDDYGQCMSIVASMNHLSKMHEDTLDSMLSALFLRKNQTKLHAATCGIFQVGLHAAKVHSGNMLGQTCAMQYDELRKALNHWFTSVEQTMEKTNNRDLHTVDYLLNQVDGSRYYQHTRGKE